MREDRNGSEELQDCTVKKDHGHSKSSIYDKQSIPADLFVLMVHACKGIGDMIC